MRRIIQFIFHILLACIIAPAISRGCSLAATPVKGFDPAEYIFTGEVVNIVGPFESKKFKGKTWGLKVKVDEAIYLPKTPAGYFEVFPYELGADCLTGGTSKEKLEKYYPVGTKIKVIAKEAKLLPVSPSGGNIRLEDLPGSPGSVSRNNYEDGRLMASARPVFDYKNYRQVTPADYVGGFMPFLDARVRLPEFELRKDLLRLRNAKTESEKFRILERLLYYPERWSLDFAKIAQDYVKEPATLKTLNDRRAAWDNRYESPETK
ncbi:MAG TPA: hypothetical protein VEY11_07860 [Pyrinomonadaceae bacterium]|nr:hypothetical protein [Pyrinomonadaceae bacterium]